MRISIIAVLLSLFILDPIRSCSSNSVEDLRVEDLKQGVAVYDIPDKTLGGAEDNQHIKSIQFPIKNQIAKHQKPVLIFTENPPEFPIVNAVDRQSEEVQKDVIDDTSNNVDEVVLVVPVVEEQKEVQVLPQVMTPVLVQENLPPPVTSARAEYVKKEISKMLNFNIGDMQFRKYRSDFEKNTSVRIKLHQWIDRVISNNRYDVKEITKKIQKKLFTFFSSEYNRKLTKLLEGLETKAEDIETKLDELRYPEDLGLDPFEDVDKFEKIILYKEIFDKTEKLREEFKNVIKGILKNIEDES